LEQNHVFRPRHRPRLQLLASLLAQHKAFSVSEDAKTASTTVNIRKWHRKPLPPLSLDSRHLQHRLSRTVIIQLLTETDRACICGVPVEEIRTRNATQNRDQLFYARQKIQLIGLDCLFGCGFCTAQSLFLQLGDV
jgi:hypothetical protein